MNGFVAEQEIRQSIPDAAPEATRSRLRRFSANFWLNFLFFHTMHAPWAVRWSKWFFLWFALNCSKIIQRSTALNARRIFGPQTTDKQCRAFMYRVVSNFYDFVYDVGVSLRLDREGMLEKIESVDGEDRYKRVRIERRGAIIATAHMGSFEAGAAALATHEKRMHVLFKRDVRGGFEEVRSRLRQKLGIVEALVDDGWIMWMRLREALLNDEVVMLQIDRVMPGQKGTAVPFLHGHLLLPTGPLKLALASGAPIIPVFTTRAKNKKICIHIEQAIYVASADDLESARVKLARVLEKYVRQFPEQWLVLQPAFLEDTHQDRPENLTERL